MVTYHLESEDMDLYATFSMSNIPCVSFTSVGESGTVRLIILGIILSVAGGIGEAPQGKTIVTIANGLEEKSSRMTFFLYGAANR